MPNQLLLTLSTLTLTSAQTGQLGLEQSSLKLRRARPRNADHVGLEYLADNGQIVPGQWLANPGQLEQVARQTSQTTARATVAVVDVVATKILLQSYGADRHLPGLAPLLAQPGARLLVHRPERRAVVRLETSNGAVFAKIVRPEKVGTLVAMNAVVRELVGQQFAVPRLLDVDEKMGVTLWSALRGRSLYDLVPERRFIREAGLAGAALRTLHSAAAPKNIGRHSATDEIAVLQSWINRLQLFVPDRASVVSTAATETLAALANKAASPKVLLHRDFYDKQLFIDDDDAVGLLDFDTLTTGEAALDLANALAHFELRAFSGRCSRQQAWAAIAAMIDGYQPGPDIRRRLNLYADATRLRLACVYAFRPYGVTLLPSMLAQVGQPMI